MERELPETKPSERKSLYGLWKDLNVHITSEDIAEIRRVPQDVMDDVLELTADYMFARYPDVADQVPYEAYNQQIAREKVNRARSIFELLKKRLQGSEIQEIEEKKDEREEHETNE